MQFAICNEIFQGWKLQEVIPYAAQLGYAGVEIAPFTLAESVGNISATERRKIGELARTNNIQIVGLHWLLVKPEGLHITSPDAAVRERTARYLADLVDFCADIGGRIMVFGSPRQRNILPNVSREQAASWAVAAFSEAVKRAEDRAVTLCLEPLSPAETNFINTAEEAIRFVEQFKSPNFKIILDVKAMCAEVKSFSQIIRDSWPHFAHFHANDQNLRWPGSGDVDFEPIASTLKQIGYNGFVSVEVFKFEEGPQAIALKSIEYLTRVFA